MAKTIMQFRADLKEIKVQIKRELIDPVRLESGHVAADIRRGIKATDIGRALWGRRRKGGTSGRPPLVIKRRRARISASEGGIVGGVDVRGMAALIILGGRTSAHIIEPREASVLSFGPDEVVTGSVRHSGSLISSRGPIVDKALDRALPRLEKRIERTFESVARRALQT